MLSFLLVDRGRAFHYKIVLRGIRRFLHGGALGLLWNATNQRSFWSLFRHILYTIVKKITFFKGNLCICEYFIHVLLIHFESAMSLSTWDLCWILPCALLILDILLAWTDPRASWYYAHCFWGLTYGFLNKIFGEIISLSVVACSFIDNISSKHDPDTTSKFNESVSHHTHHFCEDVGEFYIIFTFRFSFWALFDTQLMNFIWKYVFYWLHSLSIIHADCTFLFTPQRVNKLRHMFLSV